MKDLEQHAANFHKIEILRLQIGSAFNKAILVLISPQNNDFEGQLFQGCFKRTPGQLNVKKKMKK